MESTTDHRRKTTLVTRSTITSNDNKNVLGKGPIDMKSLLSTNTMAPIEVKKVLSWKNILEGSLRADDVIKLEPVLFSDNIKKAKADAEEIKHPEVKVNFRTKFCGPYLKETPLVELSKKPGHIPISGYFHIESHRLRRDSDDDGLDPDDLTG